MHTPRLTLLATLLATSLAFAQSTQPTTQPTDESADATSETTLNPRVRMHLNFGDETQSFVLRLNGERAPITVHNFVRYANEGFYEGTIFHRVIKTFMVQGGGYTAAMDLKQEGLHEGIENEWENGLKNDAYTIAMARIGGRPNSATAQFFINVVNNAQLSMAQRDGAGYAVFGHVIEGKDVINKIRDASLRADPKLAGMGPVVPETPIVIEKVEVLDAVDMSAFEKQVEKAAAERAAAKEAEMKEVLEGMAALGEVTQTESGLHYVMMKKGEGPNPTLESKVKVHYAGTLTNGTEFDSSYKRGTPAEFPLGNVIQGWQEAVQLLQPGGKMKVYIPYELAYGERGRPPVIPPQAPLIFEIELLEIVQ